MTAARDLTEAIARYTRRWEAKHRLQPVAFPPRFVLTPSPYARTANPVGDIGYIIFNESPDRYNYFWYRAQAVCYEHPAVGLVVLYAVEPDPTEGLREQTRWFGEVAERLGAGFAASAPGYGPDPTVFSIRHRVPCSKVTFAFVFPDTSLGATVRDATRLARAVCAPFDPVLAEMPKPAVRTRYRADDLFPWGDPSTVDAPGWLLRLRHEAKSAQIEAERARRINEKKTCQVCGEVKPRREFYNSATHSDGYMSRCKSCDGTKIDARIKRNPAARAKRVSTSRVNNAALTELSRRHPEEFATLKAALRGAVEADTTSTGKVSVRLRHKALAVLREAHADEFAAIRENLALQGV